MHVVLTHEQADFDALASLIGVYLLDEQAVPVLPRRMNRNVRAFLTLYGLEFPFLDPRDLPKNKINRITLVDTQSLITLKGTTNQTEVYIIDHHSPRPDLPEHWHITSEDLGATTTLFIEALQEQDIRLNVHQATLLLLGIYEDTGRLTYTRTSPRDVRAAAFLLEQGASLQIMQDFLNHPLSHLQQAIYDQLRKQIKIHIIHGNTIMIGCADAKDSDEELSTIAHKLRDLLDPDAIFLLMDTGAGTQLIARSTTDQVNVGNVAAHFGGGGHPRAAAALVRELGAEELNERLITILPDYVKPAITVAEILSRRPQLLTPDTPVRKAAEQMQRYGYEGFPVVEDGVLIGLLTRRAVDRTLSHKLNLSVGEVMDAGAVTITPDASLETLQQLMTDTDWGQIPVVENGEIIGIVTRTDLIKTLTPRHNPVGRSNLAGKIEASLPPARLALLQTIAEQAQTQQASLYIVGGFVRDLILDRPSLDFDLVVEGDAIALGKALSKKYGGKTTSHARFGTSKWWIENIHNRLAQSLAEEFDIQINEEEFPKTLDLISARREFYTYPTALPTVERGSIKLDLHRRDFTINTLAVRLDGGHYGELHDYWGGLDDLHGKAVRVLHSLSFVDDPTRILRAVRFEQRFDYHIEPRSLELLKNALTLLDRVSGDRIRHELNIIIQEPNALAMLNRLNELGAFQAIHSAIPWNSTIQRRIETALHPTLPPEWILKPLRSGYILPLALAYLAWFLEMDPDKAADLATRLKLPGWLASTLAASQTLRRRCDDLKTSSTSEAVTFLDQFPDLAILTCYLFSSDDDVKGKTDQYMTAWRQVQPHTSGHDLRQRGIPPGPHYKEILGKLRAAWLDERISTSNEENDLLEELLDEHTPPN